MLSVARNSKAGPHAVASLARGRAIAPRALAARALQVSSALTTPTQRFALPRVGMAHHHLTTQQQPSNWNRRGFASQPLGNVMGGGQQQQQQEQKSFLEQFSVDLTAQAQNHKLDPIIGRHEEIRRCLQILARRSKNNPILIGEAGVGKTAIAEGLAQRIVSGEVPESMKDKQVLRLDVTALLSGAMFRGQFEERVQGVIKEVQEKAGKVILFIDEIHTVVGAGSSGGAGANDMANILKPALVSSIIRVCH